MLITEKEKEILGLSCAELLVALWKLQSRRNLQAKDSLILELVEKSVSGLLRDAIDVTLGDADISLLRQYFEVSRIRAKEEEGDEEAKIQYEKFIERLDQLNEFIN